jgi:hypothetical protein
MEHISTMLHLAQNILRKIIHAAAIATLLVGNAFAQLPMPGIDLNPDSSRRPLSPEEKEKQEAIDDAYKSAIKKIPDKQKPVDPWGNIRPEPPTSSKTKHGQQ